MLLNNVTGRHCCGQEIIAIGQHMMQWRKHWFQAVRDNWM